MMSARVAVLGHVDHGKSTLSGRLLLETGSLPDGKIAQLEAISAKRGLGLELAFALDALQSERNQGITIDASHAWLRRPGRGPIVLVDAPGHEEFLRNMVTGASSADAALLVIDAREGVRPQSHRHAVLLKLLGVEQVAVAVNKMDLVGWSEAAFRAIAEPYAAFLRGLGIERAVAIPISAREGGNVARRAPEAPWWTGPSILAVLDGFGPRRSAAEAALRFPIQDVYRLGDRRILAGRVVSGTIRTGDEVVFSPWNKRGFVRTIERFGEPPLASARAGDSIGITLDHEVFIERGQVASHLERAPSETDVFEATVFWLGARPLEVGVERRLRLGPQEVACRVESVKRVLDATTLFGAAPPAGGPPSAPPEPLEASRVERNEIAEVTIRTRAPLALDDHRTVPANGRFVILDGAVVAGGGVISLGAREDQRSRLAGLKSSNLGYTAGKVSRLDRARRTGHAGRVIWFTGLPGSGKSTVAVALERALFDAGWLTYLLDGDTVRHGLSADLGFSAEDRDRNVQRVGEVAKLFRDAGVTVIVALISPRATGRDGVRAGLRRGEFVEVFADCPLEVCEQRDPKGLYRAAREGRLPGLTGVGAPYERPAAPDLVLPTAELSVEACVERIVSHLRALDAHLEPEPA